MQKTDLQQILMTFATMLDAIAAKDVIATASARDTLLSLGVDVRFSIDDAKPSAELGEELGVPAWLLETMAESGQIPAIAVGKKRLFDLAAVQRALRDRAGFVRGGPHNVIQLELASRFDTGSFCRRRFMERVRTGAIPSFRCSGATYVDPNVARALMFVFYFAQLSPARAAKGLGWLSPKSRGRSHAKEGNPNAAPDHSAPTAGLDAAADPGGPGIIVQ